MEEQILTINTMRRICKNAGADRVSKAAAKELAKELNKIGFKIAKEAVDYAKYAGRITVKPEDIQIASKKVMGK